MVAGVRRLVAPRLLVAALLVTGPLVPVVRDAASAAPSKPVLATTADGAPCGPDDAPETGLQGDVPLVDQLSGRAARGYNCGLRLVGWNPLGGRGGAANMAWAGNCAYVASTNGVAVVDVRDPRRPRHVTTLQGPGSSFVLETIGAMEAEDRSVLVTGRYGPAPFGDTAPMDVYDLTGDCTKPRKRSTLWWPTNVHNLTLTPDARHVFSTIPLQVADISDLDRPRFVANLEGLIPLQHELDRNYSHEVRLSPDGTRAYIGGQTPELGEYMTVFDLSGFPRRQPRVVSRFRGRGHGVTMATIGGRRHLLHSEEAIVDPLAKGCVDERLNPFAGVSQPWLTDIADERRPIRRSQFTLEINEPRNCAAQALSRVNGGVHYHDVDDPSDTTFAMLSMWNSGLRIVDVRHPDRPREVAYFNPGDLGFQGTGSLLDRAWGHVRYRPDTGHIWLATEAGGFWVLELEPHVRAALGLPRRPVMGMRDLRGGARPAVAATPVAAVRPVRDVTSLYCTLGSARV